ncbi:hypothetical protein [Microbacterium sp. No. 7]|uniref:hypothetical protein n=1 Tax=Microbacterium sp. No. 7 TaxID=1714373 RepID=UPI0006CF859F|nr:hypothetical protein [Microbacterium sp. No. 7]ALJ20493.1 hypothetical protein AOA12_11490 [Microbacterium sp. No. 7]
MEELAGRLPALDPGVGESLKVVAYFDALSVNGAGHDALLRAAAVLSGTVAGSERQGRVVRFDSAGRRVSGSGDADERRPGTAVGAGRVWLERSGPLHANDEMIVERLAHALALLESRHDHSGGFAVVIDATRSIEERSTMLTRLRIAQSARIRLIATAPDAPKTGALSSIVPTRYGLLQASLDTTGEPVQATRAGFGLWTRADHAPESWDDAVIAYRLSTEDLPMLDAVDLGSLLPLVRGYDHDTPHHDVVVLSRLDRAEAEALRVLVEAESVRSAAVELRLHHSTLQAKHRHLTHTLGYDPRTTGGRARYVIAEILRRLEPDR